MGRLEPAGLLVLLLYSLSILPGTARSLSVRAARRQLREIYEAHRPDRLNTIDALLQEYAGHEDVLLAAVQKKYGLDEGNSADHTHDDSGSTDTDSSCTAGAAAAVVWPNTSGVMGSSCDTLNAKLAPADFFRPLPDGAHKFVNEYWGRSPVALKRSVCKPNSNYDGAGLDDLARLFPGAFGSVDAKRDLALLSFVSCSLVVVISHVLAITGELRGQTDPRSDLMTSFTAEGRHVREFAAAIPQRVCRVFGWCLHYCKFGGLPLGGDGIMGTAAARRSAACV